MQLDDDEIATTAYYFGRPMGHIIALEAGYDLSDEWRIGGNAEVALENKIGSLDLPAYEVANVFASYAPTAVEGLEIRLGIDNLFDATYASRSSDGLDLSAIEPLNEPGRTFTLTASLQF